MNSGDTNSLNLCICEYQLKKIPYEINFTLGTPRKILLRTKLIPLNFNF